VAFDGIWAGFSEGGAAAIRFADVAGSTGDAVWPAALLTKIPAIATKLKKIGESFPRMMTSQVLRSTFLFSV
jgi:hypothetical protein